MHSLPERALKLYIAGPMRGYAENNFPAFARCATRLRLQGHEVVSPAEMDLVLDPDAAKLSEVGIEQFKEFMRRDLDALLLCDGVWLLDNWTSSAGALIEAYVAIQCGLIAQDISGSVDVKDVVFAMTRRLVKVGI
jgi:hypothetical protein